MVKLIINIVLLGLAIFFHDNISRMLFQMGGSWTLSKLLPYLVCWLLALLAFWLSFKFFKKNAMGAIIGSLIFGLAFGVDFYLHPIYEGDFSNNSRIIKTDYKQFEPETLTVLAIPGCPFCHASVGMLKVMKERVPGLKINYVVCSPDSNDLKDYTALVDGKFNLELIDDLHILDKIAVMGFPTFVYTDNAGKKQLWSNDNFGAPARDLIEKSVH